ncbi:MAG: class I SAM-dependent methyltransferase [Cyanobacteria bacterium]|nr:class I SAM-dependent methyltransferase [Cyanobacteriota bacterium]
MAINPNLEQKNTVVQTETLTLLAQAVHYNQWIFDAFRPVLGSRVLEVGCGIGTYTQMLLNTPNVTHVTALETEAGYIPILKEQVTIPVGKTLDARCQNILETVEGLGHFNTCIMLNVLEHIEDDVEALKTLKHLLGDSPDGHVVIFVPALMSLYSDYDRSIYHYRRYHKESLQKVLLAAGFEIQILRYFNFVGILGWWVRFCLLKQKEFDKRSIGMFEKIAPFIKAWENRIPPPIGLSLVAIATPCKTKTQEVGIP